MVHPPIGFTSPVQSLPPFCSTPPALQSYSITMTTLTLDLIRKKAEHHNDTLATLQELSLHQLNLTHLTPILSQACPQLRILYLHNNLLSSHPTFRQLHRLKSLVYLNLTLNNITSLPQPHLAALEKLAKLDLTLNHIPLTALDDSLTALEGCERLTELYLTGNPCMQWSGCRLWVVGRLVRLQRLDGVEVTRSERLTAQQQWGRLTLELQEHIDSDRKQKQADDSKEGEEATDTRFTPALRMRMYEEQKAAEEKQQAEAATSAAAFHPPTDLYSAARQRLNTFLNPADYCHTNLPSQRNIGRYPFTLMGSTAAVRCAVLRVEVPRHMDTSSVRVDVQPWWVQVDVKGQLLVLHTGEEVEVGRASVKRVVSDGSLVVKMPVVRKEEVVVREEEKEGTIVEEEKEEVRSESEHVVVVKGRGRDGRVNSGTANGWKGKLAQTEKLSTVNSSMVTGMTQVSVTRSATLEAKRQMEQEAWKQRQSHAQQKAHTALDDDDVPPLI